MLTDNKKKEIHIINVLAWAKIVEELQKRGVKFAKGFSGVGDSYAGFTTLCEETEPKLLSLCESIRAEALKEVDYFAEILEVDKEFEDFTHFENGFDHFRSKLQAKLAVLAKLSQEEE